MPAFFLLYDFRTDNALTSVKSVHYWECKNGTSH